MKTNFANYIDLFQDIKVLAGNDELKPNRFQLSDFYMSNSVTRASKTMAKCVQAALDFEKDKAEAKF